MFRDILISLSFANICLGNIWLRFFYRSKFCMKYFPTANSFLALILNEVLFTLIIWGSLWLIRRFKNKIVVVVVKILVCLFVLTFISAIANSFPEIINKKIFNLVFLAVIIILLWRRSMVKTTMIFILVLAPFALIILGQSVQGVLNKDNEIQLPIISRKIMNPNYNTPRVLWLIFDEMDQRIAFIDRPKNIELLEFDRLKRESLFAENAYPPGRSTTRSIPALINGKLISRTERFSSDILKVTFEGSNHEENWGNQPNVFSRAKKMGVNTALIGEYLPYSRLIGQDLDYCTWSAYRYQYVSSKDTLWDNFHTQIYGFFHVLKLHYVQHQIAYNEIFDGARKLAVDPRYGLIFIHFPVPHSPFIYKHSWWDQSTKDYADNLILCDYILSRIRKDMEIKGIWDNTTIIISSDHWFRDSEKFDGKEDYRIPFIVKLAKHNDSIVYPKDFNTVLTHDLVMDIFSKKITTPNELVQWLNIHKDLTGSFQVSNSVIDG